MKNDEFEDEYLYSDEAVSESDEGEDPLEDDEISPEEEGFLRGYEEANENPESEDEEEAEE